MSRSQCSRKPGVPQESEHSADYPEVPDGGVRRRTANFICVKRMSNTLVYTAYALFTSPDRKQPGVSSMMGTGGMFSGLDAFVDHVECQVKADPAFTQSDVTVFAASAQINSDGSVSPLESVHRKYPNASNAETQTP